MLSDFSKYVNKDNNTYKNQQVIGHKDLFRGVIVIEQVILNQNWINFNSHIKVIAKSCVEYNHEC